MVKYEIARQKAVDAWLDATTPKPADVTAQVERLREAARDRQREGTCRDWAGPADGLEAAVAAVAYEANQPLRQSGELTGELELTSSPSQTISRP